MVASEETHGVGLNAPQFVQINFNAVDAPRFGQDLGLRSDELSNKNPPHWHQAGIQIKAFQIPGQLFNTIDLTTTLDFYRHGPPLGVPTQQVNRTDIGGVLATDQFKACFDHLGTVGKEHLQMGFDPVFLQPWVDAELMPIV